MHAPYEPPAESSLHATWRHPTGAAHYFNDSFARSLIEQYNRTGDNRVVDQLLRHTEPLIKSLLEYRCTTRREALDEMVARIEVKLWRSLRLFDVSRGSAFSFCAKVISSTAASIVGEAWTRSERFTFLPDDVYDTFTCNESISREANDEIQHKVRQVKTSCTDPAELDAQKWFVESFLDCSFHIKRHEAGDAVMQVFGLNHARVGNYSI